MSHRTQVAIIGQGYVGLPLAIAACQAGHEVIGLDLNAALVEQLNSGNSHVEDVDSSLLQKFLKLNTYRSTTDARELSDADVILIAVPTPLSTSHEPDLSMLETAARIVGENIKTGALVINESTSYPGTLRNIIRPIVESSALTAADIDFAISPERVDPGNPTWKIRNTPRLYSGLSQRAKDRAREFYGSFCDELIELSEPEVAEAAKLFENTFRLINISLVNELALVFSKMGIDTREVLDAASTKPYGFTKFNPSVGIGGHCIPVDPYYLIEKAKQSGFDHKFLRTAREINNSMPAYTVESMQDLLNEIKLPMKDTAIGVMGLSYKANVDDLRESPAIKIISELKKKKTKIIRYDPFIKSMSDVADLKTFLKKCTAIILVTNHSEFAELDPKEFKKNGVKAIVDGMNCLDKNKIKKLGIKYRGIGRK